MNYRPRISRISRMHTGSHPKKIRPIRAIRVRKKYIFAYVFYSFDHKSPESHEYIPGRNLQDS